MDRKKGRNTWRWGTISQIREREQLKAKWVSRVSQNRDREGNREKGRNQKWREFGWRGTQTIHRNI